MEVLQAPQFCDNCGERCWRVAYVISGITYCHSCMEKLFVHDISDEEEDDE